MCLFLAQTLCGPLNHFQTEQKQLWSCCQIAPRNLSARENKQIKFSKQISDAYITPECPTVQCPWFQVPSIHPASMHTINIISQRLTELNCIQYEEKLFQIKYPIDWMPAPLTASLSLTALSWLGWEQVSFGSKQKGSCKSYLSCNLFFNHIVNWRGEKICNQICYDQTILCLNVAVQLYIGVYICSSLPNK